MKKKRILIYGAGFAGRVILKEILKSNKTAFIAGFIDDDDAKINKTIDNRPILGSRNDLIAILKSQRINKIIFALPSKVKKIINSTAAEIINLFPDMEIEILPNITRYFDYHLLADLETVSLTEILDRDEIELDISGINLFLKNKTVLITGAGGSIGSELSKQILRFGIKKLICLGRGEDSIYKLARRLKEYEAECEIVFRIADTKNAEMMNRILADYSPQIVFHAAAHKHVPAMEMNPHEAFLNNVQGTLNVLEACRKSKIEKFIFISTDKAVNPVNVMGATKRAGELLTLTYAAKKYLNTSIVRFGNVIGSRGSAIPLFMDQIRCGGPVTVTHPDIQRFFMSIPEAVLLVINAAMFNHGNDVFLLDMGEPYKILDVAKKLIKNSGFVPDEDIMIEFTGLRPGEKLFEELSYGSEKKESTPNKSIFLLKHEPVDVDTEMVRKISSEIQMKTDMEVREILKSIVKDYTYSGDAVSHKRIVS
ncbi:MAG: polysaccharide biosynthesis protein [Spirochaetes bacterium]|nr:polysaccharide biosynthesis protein [Spirochaetota bacterium]